MYHAVSCPSVEASLLALCGTVRFDDTKMVRTEEILVVCDIALARFAQIVLPQGMIRNQNPCRRDREGNIVASGCTWSAA